MPSPPPSTTPSFHCLFQVKLSNPKRNDYDDIIRPSGQEGERAKVARIHLSSPAIYAKEFQGRAREVAQGGGGGENKQQKEKRNVLHSFRKCYDVFYNHLLWQALGK